MIYSFLIVNYNMGALVRRLVEDLAGRMPSGSYEVIVAENSTDPRFDLHSDWLGKQPSVRVVKGTPGSGLVDALNRILPCAAGQFTVILHPDIELEADCLEKLRGFLEGNPGAAVAAPDHSLPDRLPRLRLCLPTLGGEFRLLLNLLGGPLFKRPLVRDYPVWERQSDAQTETVSSVCMMLRTEALKQISGIDTRLDTYWVNDYLCARFRANGWTCHYVQAARVLHLERFSPLNLYSGGADMVYKRSASASLARMRRDYLSFVAILHPPWRAGLFRALALLEDLGGVATNLLRRRNAQLAGSWQSLLVCLGARPMRGRPRVPALSQQHGAEGIDFSPDS